MKNLVHLCSGTLDQHYCWVFWVLLVGMMDICYSLGGSKLLYDFCDILSSEELRQQYTKREIYLGLPQIKRLFYFNVLIETEDEETSLSPCGHISAVTGTSSALRDGVCFSKNLSNRWALWMEREDCRSQVSFPILCTDCQWCQIWELTRFSSTVQCRGVSVSLPVYQLNAFLSRFVLYTVFRNGSFVMF